MREVQRKKRKTGTKEIKPEKWMIFSEGRETEPNYFKGLEAFLNKSGRKKIKIIPKGTGKNTLSLVSYIDRKYGKVAPCDVVAAVFDKDEYSDKQFNEAINNAINSGYKVGWSNECFELWLLLHFTFNESDLSRGTYDDKLSELFKSNEIDANGYSKNDTEIFSKVSLKGGSVANAINNAKKLMSCNCKSPAKKRPGTELHNIVQELARAAGYDFNCRQL